MTNGLDERIRDLVSDVVGATPPAPSFDELPGRSAPLRASRARRQRTRAFVAGAIAVGVAVMVAAVIASTRDGVDSSQTAESPAARPARSTIDIFSLPNLRFDQTRYETTAGPVEIRFQSRGGSHELAITGPGSSRTIASSNGDVVPATINLAPGEYTLYCDVPGHRAAGEEAILVVRPKGAPEVVAELPRPWNGVLQLLSDGSLRAPGFNEFVGTEQPDWSTDPEAATRQLLGLGAASESGVSVVTTTDGDGATVTIERLVDGDDSVAGSRHRVELQRDASGRYLFGEGSWAYLCKRGPTQGTYAPRICV